MSVNISTAPAFVWPGVATGAELNITSYTPLSDWTSRHSLTVVGRANNDFSEGHPLISGLPSLESNMPHIEDAESKRIPSGFIRAIFFAAAFVRMILPSAFMTITPIG
ncbi:MAG: hypothetical protein WCG81_08965 [Candidatus Angelobacter sp.]